MVTETFLYLRERRANELQELADAIGLEDELTCGSEDTIFDGWFTQLTEIGVSFARLNGFSPEHISGTSSN